MVEEAGGRGGPAGSTPAVEGGDGNNAGGLISQAEDAHARTDHGTPLYSVGHALFRAGLRVETWHDRYSVCFRSRSKRKGVVPMTLAY